MDDDPQTFSCRHCGATERYDREPFYLLEWWQAGEAFDQRHAACAAESVQASILGPLGDEVATDSGQSEMEAP